MILALSRSEILSSNCVWDRSTNDILVKKMNAKSALDVLNVTADYYRFDIRETGEPISLYSLPSSG